MLNHLSTNFCSVTFKKTKQRLLSPVLLTYLVAMKTKNHLHVSKCAAFVDKMSTA